MASGYTLTITVTTGKRKPDLNALADRVASILRDGNRKAALAGLDIDEQEYAELKASTIARGRGGDGAPLDPRREASRIIRNFRVTKKVTGNTIKLICVWVNLAFLRFHQTGTRYMASRNPIGIRDTEYRTIERLLRSQGVRSSLDLITR